MMKKFVPIGVLLGVAAAACLGASSNSPTRAEMEAEFAKRDKVIAVQTKVLLDMEDYFSDLQQKNILPKPEPITEPAK